MRGNIVVEDTARNSNVFLYAHNTGHSLPLSLRTALQRRERWNDPQYLARMIFCQTLIDNEGSLYDSGGFGISGALEDGEGKLLMVDVMRGQVRVKIGGWYLSVCWTFDEFCNIKDMRQAIPLWGIPHGYEEWFANDNK